MLFIQREWTNQRKSSYESLKQWRLPLQRQKNNKTRVWKTRILHHPFIFYQRWRFENDFTKENRNQGSL